MRRRIWVSLIAIIVLGISIMFVLYANNTLSSSQEINGQSDFPASNTITIGPYYLSRSPYFPKNSDNITKILLKSATLRYDDSNISFTADSGYDDFVGDSAVIINATVRNDYNVEEIIQFSHEGISEFYFAIDVNMYDDQGDFVPTLHRGNPFRGSHELSLESGETVSVNMVFTTPNMNIKYFKIYFSYPRDV